MPRTPVRIHYAISRQPPGDRNLRADPNKDLPTLLNAFSHVDDRNVVVTLIALSFGAGLIVATKALVDVEVPRKRRWLVWSLQLAAEQRSSGPVQPRINRSAVTRVAPRDRAAATMKRSAGSAWNSSNWAADRARAPSRGISLSPAANHSRRQLSGV